MSGQEHHHHDHDHEHGWKKNIELICSLTCGAALAIGFGLSFIKGIPDVVPLSLYILAYIAGGFFTVKEAIENIKAGSFDIDSLMIIAAAGAAILGDWAEGALLLFLFSMGHSLEHYALNKAKNSISALAKLAPKTAWLKKDNTLSEVNIETLQVNDIVMVKPDNTIPADGIIIKGNSAVNQAAVTGESMPVDKQVDSSVYAGTMNGSGALEVKVTKPAKDSTLSKLIQLVNEAQSQQSPTQRFADKLQKYYVPAVIIFVFLLCFAFVVIHEPFSASFYRAMGVLVAASPCALAISTPSAVLSGVARAARAGILIKGGRPLEDLGALKAIAFDKTGTLTEGKPKLTEIIPANGIGKEELLSMVVAVESLSDHPLAKAIVADAQLKNIEPASQLESVTGKGIKAQWQGHSVVIGNKALVAAAPDILQLLDERAKAGHTVMLALKDEKYAGMITVMDTPRAEAKPALEALRAIGINKLIMLSGDNQLVADAIARETGLTDAWGNLLPEQKVEAINKLKTSEGKVAMVGDGVNDAPAMANSTVGIAMGAAGSDVALETADIALMGDQLMRLPFAIALSQRANQIIKQNLVISLGMVAILIPLTLFGIASMGPAVIGHEGSTMVVVLNALRLLVFKEKRGVV
ncbi:heavy metal translocating P-type ATPase [Chitinophaga sancti]|uniref:P-type Zn(2+) transporter n=1 Tax=Chitinophaga sancti TaxID=1004 RepID=A0A1K1R4Y4_9BACT|nr:heavy metal translocating P-type ATPase [Chitinophaga sancti]WQD64297.1 heavy metal translocating P-type ATPase [Chitinophaga sancti]WQG90079.1 heavy metal translocating P-type ATPase [Chitinophaga sancti]SFW66662.1 Cd2+/Zn2+-exporting ATPase [Chitinophaga sancti]